MSLAEPSFRIAMNKLESPGSLGFTRNGLDFRISWEFFSSNSMEFSFLDRFANFKVQHAHCSWICVVYLNDWPILSYILTGKTNYIFPGGCVSYQMKWLSEKTMNLLGLYFSDIGLRSQDLWLGTNKKIIFLNVYFSIKFFSSSPVFTLP